MLRLKIIIIIIGISFICLDHYSKINIIRDSLSIIIHNNINKFNYKIKFYPQWFFLQKTRQRNLELENSKLRKQIEKYVALVNIQSNKNKDINEIDELNVLKHAYSNYQIIVSRIIIDVNYLINNKMLLNIGALNNISVGETVINKNGVVGQIREVSSRASEVFLLTNPDYKIYVQNEVTKVKMLLQGLGNNQLIIKYINKKDNVKIGDVLVTTGLDDLYPANVPVAKVIKVYYANNGFNTAICSPMVDFNKLQYVLVIKNEKK